VPGSDLLDLYVRHFFSRQRLQFSPHHVRGKSGAQEAPVDGSHFLFVDFAAVGAEFAFDALADHGALIILLGRLFQRGVNVPVRDAACAEVARDAKLSLLASFGALARELFGVARVVNQAVLFQAGHHQLD
jgi:hypothetical protein